jgi:hypothetical protein
MSEQMSQQVAPALGQRVEYTLDTADATAINVRRDDHLAFQAGHHHEPGPATGHQAHIGNHAAAGDVYPAIVVRTFDPAVTTANLQVFLDGNDTYWATSRPEGEGPGTWREPHAVDLADAEDVPDPAHAPDHAQP